MVPPDASLCRGAQFYAKRDPQMMNLKPEVVAQLERVLGSV